MAKGNGPALEIQWTPIGNGQIQLAVGVMTILRSPAGETSQFIPVRVWELSQDETRRLDAAIHGLIVSATMPSNGKKEHLL